MKKRSVFRPVRGALACLRLDRIWEDFGGPNVIYRSAVCRKVLLRQNWIKVYHPTLGYCTIPIKDRIMRTKQATVIQYSPSRMVIEINQRVYRVITS